MNPSLLVVLLRLIVIVDGDSLSSATFTSVTKSAVSDVRASATSEKISKISLKDEGGFGKRGMSKDASLTLKHLPNDEAPVSIPKEAWLDILRHPGALQRKAMNSKAVRPILNDEDFTKVSKKDSVRLVDVIRGVLHR